MNGNLKDLFGKLPLTVEGYWALRGRNKPWSAHYELESLKEVLSDAVEDVQRNQLKAEHPRKICVFSTLHYWIEQSMLVALGLAGQAHQVIFAWLPYADWDKEISRFDLRRQDLYTQDVLKPASQVMRLESLLNASLQAGSQPSLTPEMQKIVDQVSDYDTQYTLQIEETDFSSPLYQLRRQRNGQAARAIFDWLQMEKPDLLVIPNGTILEMGVAYQVAGLLGVETVTFEFADQQERIWLAQNDEIMQHSTADIWNNLGNQPLPEKAKLALTNLFGARKNANLWGNFARQWQQNPVKGGASVRDGLKLDARPLALLATNVLGDSLTLGRQRITQTMAEMIVKTIGYFNHHPELQLVVRVHPGELKTHGTSMIDVINEAYAELPENIHIIRPEDKTNTYDLMEIADFGVVYTTTVGMEMAMSGLPVIVTGKTHYAGKGFTLDPQTWQEYEHLLDRISQNPAAARLTPEQLEKAWLYAYLFFFEFSLPFPWHILWLHDDFKNRPMHYVLSDEGQNKYGQTFGYLAAERLDWAAQGLARLETLPINEENPL
ncbi:MAG: hypothetical protein GX768_10715 [Chloroflexi bacterium]|nr:hypothetical protein [Chloroflexota bacterium]